MYKILDEIYKQRNDYCIIGLTGKTGSGCTKAAYFLSSNKEILHMPTISIDDDSDDNRRKKHIILKYYQENWHQFMPITVRDVITTFVIGHTLDELKLFFATNAKLKAELEKISVEYDEYRVRNLEFERILESKAYSDEQNAEKIYKYIIEDLPNFSKKIKEIMGSDNYRVYSKSFQLFGDNIRSTGKALGGVSDVKHIFVIAERINQIIKALKKYNDFKGLTSYFVIDAFRNPFEVLFFRERYSAFYLIAIKSPEEDRNERLIRLVGLDHKEIEELDKKENPKGSIINDKKMFVSQNISACIQKADIHINNIGKSENKNFNELKGKLITYVCLIQHPGLITPQRNEKLMQIAYTAKVNSGCISRQVGAVVTNREGSIVSIGWNDSPKGQTQCLLRNMNHVVKKIDKNSYSDYEKTSEEFEVIINGRLNSILDKTCLKGKNLSFCFKDVHNEVKQKDNQVHTRALHAEENAFLQIVKHGGQGVNGGVLFSTASPCELCSKKAYQLGIAKIVYIEPYPGIAVSHVINSGIASPEMELFSGAIGPAYHKLYEPFLPYKDELSVFFSTEESTEFEPPLETEDFLIA